MTPAVALCAGELAHGTVEGRAEDLDAEVDSFAGQIALGPAPTGAYDDQTGMKMRRMGREPPAILTRFASLNPTANTDTTPRPSPLLARVKADERSGRDG